MTHSKKSIATSLAILILLAGLSACQKPEGPAERLGKDIDKAGQTAGQEVEKAGQQIQDAANEAKK